MVRLPWLCLRSLIVVVVVVVIAASLFADWLVRVAVVRLHKALHEVAGCIHVDMKPMQLLVDDNLRVMVNDFNSVHVMGISPTDGTFCPVKSRKRNRLEPWPSPENYAGQVRRKSARLFMCPHDQHNTLLSPNMTHCCHP